MNRKLRAIIIGITLASVTGIASAGSAQQSLAPVAVRQNSQTAGNCTPPDSSSDCTALHAQVRANFTPDEIRMLFGAATSSPGYLTSYSRVDARYKAFLRSYDTDNSSVAMASK